MEKMKLFLMKHLVLLRFLTDDELIEFERDQEAYEAECEKLKIDFDSGEYDSEEDMNDKFEELTSKYLHPWSALMMERKQHEKEKLGL